METKQRIKKKFKNDRKSRESNKEQMRQIESQTLVFKSAALIISVVIP